MRKAIALLAGLAVLAAANWTIFAREKLITEGRLVFLELAPVDPRSLMQGDYMALRFRLAEDVVRGRTEKAADGRMIVRLDARGVAGFARLDDGSPLREGEIPLRYRVRNGQVKFATNAFFFQEGTARAYEAARFGEARAAASGDLLLTGLRGKDLDPLGPARR
jgi:uncharacterized membrane-anchored protein